MNKVLGVIAALAIVGATGVANAQDAQNSNSQPVELTTVDMDQVTAGVGFGSSVTKTPRSIKAGAYTLVYSGSSWTRVKN